MLFWTAAVSIIINVRELWESHFKFVNYRVLQKSSCFNCKHTYQLFKHQLLALMLVRSEIKNIDSPSAKETFQLIIDFLMVSKSIWITVDLQSIQLLMTLLSANVFSILNLIEFLIFDNCCFLSCFNFWTRWAELIYSNLDTNNCSLI